MDHPENKLAIPTPALPVSEGSNRIIVLIKCAYWMALSIIGAMVVAAYLLVQASLAAHESHHVMQSLASTQKALSQRLVFLAGAAKAASPDRRAGLVGSLREATAEFDSNFDLLIDQIQHDEAPANPVGPNSIDAVLFQKPYHLDYFSTALIANSRRLISALDSQDRQEAQARYLAGEERARLEETLAAATLEGYTELGKRMEANADARLASLSSLHRTLFLATIAVIAMVALFIFRPLSNVIRRKTRQLVEARNSMAFIAVHDGLTGLHNRTFLMDHFDTLLKGAKRRGERTAVLQLDLDRFKQINDTLGHAAGDMVLVATAQRMRETCRASDLCVRLGGDEFVMILQGAGTTEDIHAVARRVLDRINQPLSFHGATIHPGASAGIAVFPIDADTPGDLMVHADLALYSAKKLGGGAVSFFSEELRRESDSRKQLEHDLKIAIAERSFVVHFQPQVSLGSGEIIGVEALVRWRHPERGIVPPGAFITVAEKCGLMVDIGRIVVKKAICRAAEWHREGLEFGRLAINVSGSELREPDFDRFLFETLDLAGLPPQKLSLEIVESVMLDDERTGIADKLRHIRSAGVHLELDDFGTGYASLSHVNPNEIDRLKIDRRFVQNIDLNGGNSKIVRALTELARGLGIAIVAEGAETEAELETLMSLGCDQVQGFSIAVPMAEEAARQWLVSWARARRAPPQLTVIEGCAPDLTRRRRAGQIKWDAARASRIPL